MKIVLFILADMLRAILLRPFLRLFLLADCLPRSCRRKLPAVHNAHGNGPGVA
ncbi:MAG: hypothetical protein LBQ10_09925 [Desulfovibrio sp.]|jgi:hypothetical protein|nr:hypothetical protein [Desulfovibrio sp.]